jgi:hypothetical protein
MTWRRFARRSAGWLVENDHSVYVAGSVSPEEIGSVMQIPLCAVRSRVTLSCAPAGVVKVLLMPSNVDGNGYYRCLYPGKQLARMGHEVGWVPHQVEQHGGTIRVRYEHVQGGQVFDIGRVLCRSISMCC